MTHFVEYFWCGVHVRSQCRCASTNKLVSIEETLPCPECGPPRKR